MRKYIKNHVVTEIVKIAVKGLTTEERKAKVHAAKEYLKDYFEDSYSHKTTQNFRVRSCCEKTNYVKERMLDEGHCAELEVNGEMVSVFQDYVPVDCAEFIYVYSYIY